MSKKFKNRGNNKQIREFNSRLVEMEKGVSHKRLRLRGLCTHTSDPRTPDLAVRKDNNGKISWACRACGESVNLVRISDEELKGAIETINQAMNLIKLMSDGSERERKFIEDVVADIYVKLNAYIPNAYKSALNTSQKQGRRGDRRHNQTRISWE